MSQFGFLFCFHTYGEDARCKTVGEDGCFNSSMRTVIVLDDLDTGSRARAVSVRRTAPRPLMIST